MKVFFAGYNIVTALGLSIEENISQILKDQTGVKICENPEWTTEPTPLSVVDRKPIENQIEGKYTLFEKFLIYSITESLKSNIDFDITSKETLIIISTTKGNIELLDESKASQYDKNRIHLWSSAQVVADYFKNPNQVVVVSNACISGVQALIAGMREIKAGRYKNVVVAGADVLSHFVVSGFQSFKSLSPEPCRPFDKDRVGLSLGEGAACILLTQNSEIAHSSKIIFSSGATANDANHISGPSRTAEGQYYAMKRARVETENIDFISAHGTATPYNDDMESIALKRHGLENIPVNSFKGYFGHTLGAAGLIESALSIYSLQNNRLFKTLGFQNLGTVEPINVVKEHQEKEIKTVLKLGSGFGGSNAALIIKKD